MTGFSFNAKAALERAQDRQALPNPPNPPNPGEENKAGLGRLGRLGTVRVSSPEIVNASPDHRDTLAHDIYEERAAIREFDGAQDRQEAERAAWGEAKQAAGITALDDWRREADDPHNPDNWK